MPRRYMRGWWCGSLRRMFLKNVEHAERMTRWTWISCASSQARVRSKKSLLSLKSRRALPRLDSNSFQRRQNFSPCSIVAVTFRIARQESLGMSLKMAAGRWWWDGLESWHKLRAELRVADWPGRWCELIPVRVRSEVIPSQAARCLRSLVTLTADAAQEPRGRGTDQRQDRSKLVLYFTTRGIWINKIFICWEIHIFQKRQTNP